MLTARMCAHVRRSQKRDQLGQFIDQPEASNLRMSLTDVEFALGKDKFLKRYPFYHTH